MLSNFGYCHWRIFRNCNLPPQKQADTAIFLCQLLSNLYQPIQVFRYDRKLKTIYIQAGMGDEIALIMRMGAGSLFYTEFIADDEY